MFFRKVFILTLLLSGCSNKYEYETKIFFEQNSDELNKIVILSKKSVNIKEIQKKISNVCPPYNPYNPGIGCEYLSKPFIFEVTPINFYYVLVFVENANDIKKSNAFLDEGKIINNIGKGWYIVKRGFM